MNKAFFHRLLHLIFLCTFLSCCSLYAQQTDQHVYDLKNALPPTPNAASLGKYADWPVSLYTGIPDINIPLYELKGRSLSIPVSLSYHASGIKVSEVASSVGLGWTLNCGGAITRAVKGFPDDVGTGYLLLRSWYNNPGDLTSGVSPPRPANMDSLNKIDVANGRSDGEPDVWMFNAMGKSFKFFFSGDGTIVTQPYSNLKIINHPSDSSFIVKMEDGTKLVFGGGWKYTDESVSSRAAASASEVYTYLTAWYLKSITSVTGEQITFAYDRSSIIQDAYYYEADYGTAIPNGGFGTSGYPTTKGAVKKYATQTSRMLNIASVESDLGKVIFISDTTARLDLPGGSVIKQINVYSKAKNINLTTYNLNYIYTQAVNSIRYNIPATANSCLYRLKLTSVTQLAGDNSANKTWSFDYNPNALPSRQSLAQDYWGYFNGAVNNTTLLPFVFGFENKPYGTRGADSASMQAEMLTKITYPTKGFSLFKYEPHGYLNYEEQLADTYVYPHLYLTANQSPFVNSQSNTVIITQPQYFQFTFTGTFSSSYLADFGVNTVLATAGITNSSGTSLASIPLKKGDSGVTKTSTSVLLNPGTYTFTMQSNSGSGDFGATSDNVNLNASYKYKASQGSQYVNHKVGGVRVSSITDYDNVTGISKSRYFQYENPLVIATVDSLNDYKTTTTVNKWDDTGNETSCGVPGCLVYSIIFPTRNSSTNFGLGNIEGGTVGYGKITTKYGPNGENGKTVSYFSLYNDLHEPESKVFPYPPVTSLSWRRGLLLKEINYTSAGIPLSKTTNTYSFLNKGKITALKAAINYEIVSQYFTYNYLYEYISTHYFDVITEQVQQQTSSSVNYNNNGNDSTVVTQNLYYDNAANLKPTRVEVANSKGETVKTINRTPLEKNDINSVVPLTAIASAAIDTMLARNMLEPVVQSENYINNIIFNRTHSDYANYNTNPLLNEVKTQEGNNALQSRLLINNYDNYGNLLDQQKTGGPSSTVLYSYVNTYPIAQINNMSYSQVATILGASAIQTFGSKLTASKAEIESFLAPLRTTSPTVKIKVYVYDPLVGIISMTDAKGITTYYEYDGLQRLMNIRDKDGNIIKHMDYHYQNQ